MATLFVAVALVIYVSWAVDAALLGFDRVGVVAIAILVLGVAASLSAVVPWFTQLLHGSRLYLATASLLGLVALAAGLWALVAGEAAGLTGLIVATVLLWGMSTVRHLAMQGPQQHLRHR